MPVRDVCAALVAVAAAVALAVSIVRRKAGVAGERARQERKAARVAAMVGERRPTVAGPPDAATRPPAPGVPARPRPGRARSSASSGWWRPAIDAGGPDALAVVRTLAGAVFLGAVSDAMLLGHWYLVQPGLGREPLLELNRWLALTWPLEVGALLWPTGMLSVLSGIVDDGWNGTLGWFWVACAVTTLVLTVVTRGRSRRRPTRR